MTRIQNEIDRFFKSSTFPDYKSCKSWQVALSRYVSLEDTDKRIKWVAGADISFNKHSNTVYAGIILFRYPEIDPYCFSGIQTEISFPYIPGLLAFREMPPLMETFEKLPFYPDLMILDGHRIAHPRRLGIAGHFGIWSGIPSIGCAKNPLSGSWDMPSKMKGAVSPIYEDDTLLGYVVRTKSYTNPVFVSPGHLMSPYKAMEWILQFSTRYKLPEPTRMAHIYVNKLRNHDIGGGILYFNHSKISK